MNGNITTLMNVPVIISLISDLRNIISLPELDKTQEELMTTTEKLKEKENSLSSAELEVNALNRRVQGLEDDLESAVGQLH